MLSPGDFRKCDPRRASYNCRSRPYRRAGEIIAREAEIRRGDDWSKGKDEEPIAHGEMNSQNQSASLRSSLLSGKIRKRLAFGLDKVCAAIPTSFLELWSVDFRLQIVARILSLLSAIGCPVGESTMFSARS